MPATKLQRDPQPPSTEAVLCIRCDERYHSPKYKHCFGCHSSAPTPAPSMDAVRSQLDAALATCRQIYRANGNPQAAMVGKAIKQILQAI